MYQQVCAACHSLEYISFRHLSGVSHTPEEVKALAAEVTNHHILFVNTEYMCLVSSIGWS